MTGCTVTPSCDRVDLAVGLRSCSITWLRHVRRDGEADPDVAVRARQDLRVDADQLALGVHERAAGVAVIDRRVGLQEVLVAAVADGRRPPLRADDPHRHRLADAERIADREHDVADLHRVGVAERDRRADPSPSTLIEREVARLVGADHFRGERAAVGQLDPDLVGAVDDVVVGQDVAVGADDDAGAERRAASARGCAASAAAAAAELIAEEPAEAGRRPSPGTAVGDIFALPSVRMVTTAGATTLTTSAYESRLAGDGVLERRRDRRIASAAAWVSVAMP